MIKTLIGIRIRSAFTAMMGKNKDGSVKKKSVGRIVLMSVLYLYLAVVFIGMFTFLALSTAPMLIAMELDWLYFALFMLIAFAFVFIFSIFETKSELFECKDNELLLAMPISPRHIVLSRIFTVLIYNYVECALVMLPAIAVYSILGGSPLSVLGAFAVTLFLPLLATSLASAVGYLVALISKMVKRRSLVTTVISLAFLALYFWGYSKLMSFSEGGEEIDFSALSEGLAPFRFIGLSATLHPICTPVFIAVSLIAAFVAYRVISHSYISIVTDNRGASRTEYVARRLEKRGVLVSLSFKELRRFLSSSTYMLNGALGLVFCLFLSVFAVIKRSELLGLASAVSVEMGVDASGILAALAVAALILCNSMTVISSAALSLEGKSLWILRSMPIAGRTVLLAKSMPHIIVSLPFTLVSSILLIIASGAAAEYWAFFILTPTVAVLFSAFLGVVLNTAFPKFEFANEAQPIKQSLSVFVVMISLMLYGLICIGLSLLLSVALHPLIACLAVLVFSLALAAVSLILLLGPCARRYDRLSA